MNRFLYIIFSVFVVIGSFILIDFGNNKIDIVEVKENSDYIVKDSPSKIENFLPNKIDKNMIFTYKIKYKNSPIKNIENIPSMNKIFYISTNSKENKRIPIPLIDKINYNFIYSQNKITECKIVSYVPNVFYFNSLRTEISIFCKSDDQKTTVALTLIEKIGLANFEIAKISSVHKIIYKLSLLSIKNKNKETFGNNLFTPDFLTF